MEKRMILILIALAGLAIGSEAQVTNDNKLYFAGETFYMNGLPDEESGQAAPWDTSGEHLLEPLAHSKQQLAAQAFIWLKTTRKTR